jgi:hypothetical protein
MCDPMRESRVDRRVSCATERASMIAQNLPKQSYDEVENVVSVWHDAPVQLETAAQLVAYFDAIVGFWRRTCLGKKAYYLVDWRNFTTNVRENDLYAAQVKRVVDQCAVTIVRYCDNPLQRTAGRLVAVKLHVPSHIYDTREEAVAVIRGLKRGEVSIG